MSRLDDMLTRARDLGVRDAHAERYVAELGRWARPEPARSRAPWFAFALAATAAAALLMWFLRPERGAPEVSAIRLGDRVAIVAEPNTQYRVLAADHDRTEVLVERGTITARLWPGQQPHRLALRGEGVEAVATGTVYELRVDDSGASVHVHEGKVAVTRGGERAEITAGASWPAGAKRRDRRVADRLLALPAPPPVIATSVPQDAAVVAIVPSVAIDAPTATDAKPARVEPLAATTIDAPATLTLKERWRQARLLRGQGNFETAINECISIADAKDATWSPIALLEAARIELGPRASPERAIALADRFEAEWAAHQLGPEARELRCRALRQLGRDDECTARR